MRTNFKFVLVLAGMILQPFAARAELVLEEDRENLRQAMDVSNKAQATQNAAPKKAQQTKVQIQTAPVVQQEVLTPSTVTTVTTTDAPEGEAVENLSTTELLRRERVREELKNEDILQTRIEELRLRDERRRTKKLLSIDGMEAGAAEAAVQTQPSSLDASGIPAPLATEQVGGAMPGAPAPSQMAVQPLSASEASSYPGPVTATAVVNQTTSSESSSEKTQISIMPRAGISNMNATEQYKVTGRYSAGLGVIFGVSDSMSLEGGWSHSEYGVSLQSTNPFVQQYQNQYSYQGGDFNRESQAMKQDVFDLGLRIHLMGKDSKFRPWVGGGAAYGKSYLNYDQKIIDAANSMNYPIGSDYEMSSFLGTLSTGFDVAISKSISVGALFRYHWVLSSRESSNIDNAALYGQNPYGGYSPQVNPYYYAQNEADKRYVGGSLSRAGFYSVLAGVTFTF